MFLVTLKVEFDGGEVREIHLWQGLDGNPLSTLCPSPLWPVAALQAGGHSVPILHLSQLEKGGGKEERGSGGDRTKGSSSGPVKVKEIKLYL